MVHGNYHLAEVESNTRTIHMNTSLTHTLEKTVDDFLLITFLYAYSTINNFKLCKV